MFATILIIAMSIFFLLEIIILYRKNGEYQKAPREEEYKKYTELVRVLTNNTFTLATLTFAILALFILQESHVGTQALLIYGLSLLFLSAFLEEFSGLKRIVYFFQRRALHYWVYSIIAAIGTLYINPSITYDAKFDVIVGILVFLAVLIFCTHLYSFKLEIKTYKRKFTKNYSHKDIDRKRKS
ncbi:hypothetical protein HYX13_05905 [Candidatus Woesearchaeota archaeon]|nr:hypothetical protein [Candidatus Woesearchaeota archaeon]